MYHILGLHIQPTTSNLLCIPVNQASWNVCRAAGTGQAGQAKAGPLFLDSPLYGIDRPIIILGNDRQASIFVH